VLSASLAHAQSKTLEWRRLDSDITVQPNGDLRIAETNVVDFTNGTFTFGFRDFDTSRLTDIADISVASDGVPLRFDTGTTDEGKFRIKYFFDRPARNEERNIVLEYTVRGATRYYPDGDQVYWAAVFPDRGGFPVLNSTATVRLPNGATAIRAEAYGVPADVKGIGESIVVANALAPIDSGNQFEVRAQFPHGIITGSAPPWQQAFDSQRQYDETVKPTTNLVSLLLGLLLFIGGPALVVVLWYGRGRDPDVGMVAEYLNEPPNIPPGVAGTLIDETADMQDVIATLVDLARRGVLTMREQPESQLGGLMTTNGWVFASGPNFNTSLAPFEKQLIDALNLRSGERSLSSLKNRFYTALPGLQTALYEEMVREGFYNNSPPTVRSGYQAIAVALGILAAALACISIFLLSAYSDLAICIPIGLGLTAVVFFVAARNMPRRTRKGAEMRMRAEAFKRYLANIEKYTDIKESKDLFDKYLPYAIAFGLEHTWVRKFTAVDAPIPGWYIPWPNPAYGYGEYGPLSGTGGALGPGVGGPDLDVGDAARKGPSIEGMERSFAGGLSSLETGLAGMFDSVAGTFGSQPAPQPSSSGRGFGGGGGGWSGGGGGGGGSSGGGGGGFG
jgi:uncharacterized membrane protein YgcG